jgi:hypothetical protein
MSQRTFGEVELLEEYTDRTLRVLPGLEEAIGSYRRALSEVLGCPSDLPIELSDHSAGATELVDLLTLIDQVPAAFAFALRELDDGHLRIPGVLSAHNHQALAAVANARIDHPDASASQVRAAAFGHPPAGPPSGPPAGPPSSADGHAATATRQDHAAARPAADGVHWLSLGVTAADAAVAQRASDQHSKAQHAARRAARSSAGINAGGLLGRAVGKAATPASIALAGVEQQLADAGDPNLTQGERLVRTTSAAIVDGGAGLVGGAAGAFVGAGVTASAVGAVGGAVAGAEAGTRVGSATRRQPPVRWLTAPVARKLDQLLGTGHDDDYDHVLDLEPRA